MLAYDILETKNDYQTGWAVSYFSNFICCLSCVILPFTSHCTVNIILIHYFSICHRRKNML